MKPLQCLCPVKTDCLCRLLQSWRMRLLAWVRKSVGMLWCCPSMQPCRQTSRCSSYTLNETQHAIDAQTWWNTILMHLRCLKKATKLSWRRWCMMTCCSSWNEAWWCKVCCTCAQWKKLSLCYEKKSQWDVGGLLLLHRDTLLLLALEF